MAKEIATHISEESFMVIHSQFLLKHLTKLGNECGGRGDFFEVASFGVRLAEIPTEVFKNNKLGYYKVPESYWMVVAKCLNEFGATDNSFYEKFLIMAQKSMVKNGRIYSPLILRSAQELVDAWRKHQEVLISYDQKYYLFTLFISMERVVRHCLEEKR